MIVGIKEFRQHVPAKSRLLAIDHSPTRLGVALSDSEWRQAVPHTVLRGLKFTESAKTLAALAKDYGVTGVVLGLPLHADGSEGPRAQSVRHFALNLDRAGPALGWQPVITFVDESYTSAAADSLIDTLDTRQARRSRDMQDALAALAIMEDALRQLKN